MKKNSLAIIAILTVLGSQAKARLDEGAICQIEDGILDAEYLSSFNESQLSPQTLCPAPAANVCKTVPFLKHTQQFSNEGSVNYDLIVALVTPTLNGLQRILEGHKVLQTAAVVGEIAITTRLARKLYQQAAKNSTFLDLKFIGDLSGDFGTLGVNYFLYRGFKTQTERVYYSLLKIPAVWNSEVRKCLQSPPSYLAPADFEYLRRGSLILVETLNIYFKHRRNDAAISLVIVFRLGNQFYELTREYWSQPEFVITPTMIRSLAFISIFAVQAPLQYTLHHGWLGFFLGIEYLVSMLWPYYYSP